MSKIKEIFNGWLNTLSPTEATENLSKERMKICSPCEWNSENVKKKHARPDVHCTACGCTLRAKTRSIHSSCPKGKWEAVT